MKTYQVLFSNRGRTDLMELREGSARILLSWIIKYLDNCTAPQARGRGLSVEADRWKYHIGRYSVLTQIYEDSIIILAVTQGHYTQ